MAGRIKVTNGKITYAEHPGGVATAPPRSAVGVDAQDGTYLRLDFVLAVLREVKGQNGAELIDARHHNVGHPDVYDLVGYFEMMAL